ncbi:hypothetical protein C408_3155 [Vibrio diabolicus E0666]|nr:hypothetical protein C408_3155 [Vibrio diabolicus E0666]
MLEVKVVVLGLDKILNFLFERFRDFIDGAPTFVAMDHEANAFFPVSTEVTFNGSAGFAQQGSRAIDTDPAIDDFANDIDSELRF